MQTEIGFLARQVSNKQVVMTVTDDIAPRPRRWRQGRPSRADKEDAMSQVTFTAHTRYRLYDLDLPHRIPGIAVGFAISKFKQIGVWNKLPPALKDKARAARGAWGGLKLTQKDLDSVPDDAWETIAKALNVRWRYTAARDG